jgi:lambda family phage tail tape measure protein
MDDPLEPHLATAADQLAAFANGPARTAADSVSDAFGRAGRQIASALGEAARTGELSVKTLAASIIRELSSIAIRQALTAPLERFFSSFGTGGGLGSGGTQAPAASLLGSLLLPQGGGMGAQGARASGGPVVARGSYLVGERGPELFTPHASGSVQPVGSMGDGEASRPVTVHIHMAQGAALSEVRRSSGLVAASLARAVRRGSGLL